MTTADDVFGDFVVAGVAASGRKKPSKREIRALLLGYETRLQQQAMAGLLFGTRASLFANLAYPGNTMAWVTEDSTASYNGIYVKSGSSGTGFWSRSTDLPYSFIRASDVGAGTANAIQATTSIAVSGSALIILNIYRANTGSPVTVSFNGGAPLTIKSNSGQDVDPGGLTAGMIVTGFISGGTLRLTSDQSIAQALYAARDRAQEWAEKAVDSPVVTGQFSAKHHATKAGLSATAASGSASSASTSAINAATSATAAGVARDQAINAAEASGDRLFYDSYADASAALAGLDDGQVVEIFADETDSDRRAIYRVESAALVRKLGFFATEAEGLAGVRDDVGMTPRQVAFARDRANLMGRGPVSDAFTSIDTYNATPTDDAARVAAAIAQASRGRPAVLAADGLGVSMSAGVRLPGNVQIEGRSAVPLVAAPGSTIDAMLAPEAWDANAAAFPAAGYAAKFRPRMRDITIDGNVANGATVARGYLGIPFHAIEYGLKIKNVSGVGYELTHRNKADDASVTGNLILNTMIGHSVENPQDTPMTIGYRMGADFNGKLTDGVAIGLHSYATQTAAQVGSAQGWYWLFCRHARTDDGLVFKHANRSWQYGTIIDEFGVGYDGAKTNFVGLDLGRITNTEAGDIGSIGGTILCRADAGDDAGITYTGIRFGNSGSASGKSVLIADNHVHLSGATAATVGIDQASDSGNTEMAGMIHDVMLTGGRSNGALATPFVLRSPYISAHHVRNGSASLLYTQANEWGHITRNQAALLSGGRNYDLFDMSMGRSGVTAGSPVSFATVTIGVNSCPLITVDLTAQNADGHVTRSARFALAAQRHTSGGNATLGTVQTIFDTGSVSNNDTSRTISSLALTATVAGGTITLLSNATFTGTTTVTEYDLIWRVSGHLLAPSSGGVLVAAI